MLKRPSIVVAASTPPPVTGQSLAGEMLLRQLAAHNVDYKLLNLSRPFHGRLRWIGQTMRALVVSTLPFKLILASKQTRMKTPLFYLQLGQSTEALARDLPLLKLASIMGLPTVLHVHGCRFRSAFESAPLWLSNSIKPEIKRASRVVVLTNGLRAMFAELISPERITVVPNPVDAKLIQAASALDPPDVSKPNMRVLYLSNLDDSKGFAEVLETARLAENQDLSMRFIFAGARTDEMSIDPEHFVRKNKLGNVDLIGPVGLQEKIDLLSTSDIFILPSQTEGLPLALLEALHFGLTVIATSVGGIPEVVKTGRNGFLVQPEPSEILDTIKHLASHPELRGSIWTNNRHDALEYSEISHGESMLKIFQEVSDFQELQ